MPVWECVCVGACIQAAEPATVYDSWGSEREAVGCMLGQMTENSEVIVQFFFFIIDRIWDRGTNYRTNMIIIVHLATPMGTNICFIGMMEVGMLFTARQTQCMSYRQ